MREYLVIIEKNRGWIWSLYTRSTRSRNCRRNGKKAEQLIFEAINFHIEGLILEGYPTPEPKSEAESLMITA